MPLSNAGHVMTLVAGVDPCVRPRAETQIGLYEMASARPATNPLDQAH